MLLCKQTEKFRKCIFCPREKPSNHAGLQALIEHKFENLHLANDCRGDKRKGGVKHLLTPMVTAFLGFCLQIFCPLKQTDVRLLGDKIKCQ